MQRGQQCLHYLTDSLTHTHTHSLTHTLTHTLTSWFNSPRPNQIRSISTPTGTDTVQTLTLAVAVAVAIAIQCSGKVTSEWVSEWVKDNPNKATTKQRYKPKHFTYPITLHCTSYLLWVRTNRSNRIVLIPPGLICYLRRINWFEISSAHQPQTDSNCGITQGLSIRG